MNSQILSKVNYFVKNRLIELSGILVVLFAIFLFVSISTYSPSDPNFIYTPENIDIENFGGFYGSVISDFLLQSIGIVSFFIVLNLLFWGFRLILNKRIINFVQKIFFTLVYVSLATTYINIFFNDSFWLIDNGNGGFVGRIIKENFYLITSIANNKYIVFSFLIFAFLFFILSLSIKIKDITNILLLPYIFPKKIFRLML